MNASTTAKHVSVAKIAPLYLASRLRARMYVYISVKLILFLLKAILRVRSIYNRLQLIFIKHKLNILGNGNITVNRPEECCTLIDLTCQGERRRINKSIKEKVISDSDKSYPGGTKL